MFLLNLRKFTLLVANIYCIYMIYVYIWNGFIFEIHAFFNFTISRSTLRKNKKLSSNVFPTFNFWIHWKKSHRSKTSHHLPKHQKLGGLEFTWSKSAWGVAIQPSPEVETLILVASQAPRFQQMVTYVTCGWFILTVEIILGFPSGKRVPSSGWKIVSHQPQALDGSNIGAALWYKQ